MIASAVVHIPLTRGLFALVDAADAASVRAHKWFAVMPSAKSHRWYAARVVNGVRVFMHRVIAQTPSGLFTDHINGNGLDNRRSNLRTCTLSQNQCNKCVGRGSNRYRGVRRAGPNRFSAVIQKNGRSKYLGSFLTETDAARAYNAAAIELHGEFATLNNL